MMRKVSALMLVGVLVAGLCAPALAAGDGPLRVLILTGRNNHDWKATTPVLREMYVRSGRFVVEVSDKPQEMTAEMLSRFDVIVSNWCAWPDLTGRQWGAGAEKALVDFVSSGKGFALFHAASATFHDWPEYQQMAGATWKLGETGHGAIHEFTVRMANSEHPVTRGLRDFVIRDELWHKMGKQQDIEVLCEAHSSQEAGGSGQDEPVVICTKFGKGRCFYNILGHDAETMKNHAWQVLMLRGTEWAATGKVTLSGGEQRPGAEADVSTGLNWNRTDNSLALMNGNKIVWRFNFGKESGRAYFHPVSLADGTELTWDSPPDHPWHHGLWFSWKFINGLNYWEEDRDTGRSAGLRDVVDMRVNTRDDFSASLNVLLDYHPPGKPAVLRERRIITVSAPDADGRYRIDWVSRFQASEQNVLLDRTPIPGEKDGVGWGGYAGLSVRMARDVTDWRVVNSEGQAGLEGHGKSARWMDFTGRTAGGREAGIAILDDPDNVRHPSPWYVAADPKVPFGYFSPALLFNGPLTLSEGQTLTLRYRVLVHPGRTDAKATEREWKRFAMVRRQSAMQRRLIDGEYVRSIGDDKLSPRDILSAFREAMRPEQAGQWVSKGHAGSAQDTVKLEAGSVSETETDIRTRAQSEVSPVRLSADPAARHRPAGGADFSQLTPEMSFGEALEILRNTTSPPLNIVVYWRDLMENANIDRDTPIQVQGVPGVSLGGALSLLLRAVGGGFADLDYTVEHGVIIIATRDSLPVRWETRVYDIRDLYHEPLGIMPFGLGGFGGLGALGGFGGYGVFGGYGGSGYGGAQR